MTLVQTIETAAHNILCERAVNGSCRFRQWFYVGSGFAINPEVEKAIHYGVLRGKSATEIAEEIYTPYS